MNVRQRSDLCECQRMIVRRGVRKFPISAAPSPPTRLFRSAAFTNSEALRGLQPNAPFRIEVHVSAKMSVCAVIRAVMVRATNSLNHSPFGGSASALAFTTCSTAQASNPLKWEVKAGQTQ
jgi:hypothetical protein